MITLRIPDFDRKMVLLHDAVIGQGLQIQRIEAIQLMQTTDIERDVRGFVIEHFLSGHAERLRDDGLLLGDVIDSVGVLDLVTYLQEHFSITVEDEEVVPGNLDTVQHLVAFIARKLGTSV